MSTTAAAANASTSVTPQGGVFEHVNPAAYSASNPVQLLIVQAGIIIIFCRLLAWPLSKIRQPRVIAEVIGGILLGPSVMGRIPGFTAAIFPKDSMPVLNAAATLGLILFLFLVGLEADFRFLVSNWRIALSVGALGMVIPFGLGAAIAYGLYHQFGSEPGTVQIGFGVFLLFVGVAMAITAFPVLCRILTELKLLGTPVGIIVLSAGVGNDVVGWILLALCVALVNAGSGLAAVWIILVSLAYVLFLFFAVRPAFIWVLRRSGSLQNGPSQSIVALTILMVLASAFFTGAIGIHPMFGGFMIGLICPHDAGFAIKITEKIEDLVTVLLLPIYFTLSGLSTNLGLLNNGITWAYVIGVIAVAFFGKMIGGTLAARANGLIWRESFTIGSLMSCKGLVELIVLNIGLQAKILSTRTFTIFVVMALVTTFATTPLVAALYPHWYQVKLEAWKRGEIDWDTGKPVDAASSDDSIGGVFSKAEKSEVTSVLAYMRLDNLPGVLSIISLLAKPAPVTEKRHPSKLRDEVDLPDTESAPDRALRVHSVRMNALTERDSSVMRVTELSEHTDRDPVLNTISTLGQVRNIAVSSTTMLSPESSFAQTLTERAGDVSADLILLPWSESGALSETPPENPATTKERFANGSFSTFIANASSTERFSSAVFVDNGFGTKKRRARAQLSRTFSSVSSRDMHAPQMPVLKKGHHIFMPYFGSEDDRLALRLVLQLAQDPTVTATIIHFEHPGPSNPSEPSLTEKAGVVSTTVSEDAAATSTIAAVQLGTTPATTVSARSYGIFFATLRDTLDPSLADRVVFESISTSTPAADALSRAAAELKDIPKNAGDLIVLGRNVGSTTPDLASEALMESDARRALGGLAEGIVGAGINASLLVVQAAVATA